MFDTFFDTICRVGVFVICAQSIVHFRPKGDYEKYLKLLVSILILIQLLLPMGSAIFGGEGEELSVALEEFKKQMEQSIDSAKEQAAAADKQLEEMTLEEVRKRMEEQEKGKQQTEQTTIEGEGPEYEAGNAEGTGEKEQEETKIEIQVEPVEPVVVGQ